MAKERERPLTCEDVRRLIEEHGGPEGLDLSGQTFVEAIDLSNLDLHGIILKDARFPTHFEGDQLVGVKFDGSNLNRADLRSIDLSYARFGMLNNEPTHLEAADFRGSSLSDTDFRGADLKGARFGVEKDSNLMPAMLDDTDFRGADILRTNFKGCYFYGTKLEGAYIRGADFTDAHLGEADWGSYKIGEEIGEGIRKNLSAAEHRYRQLKMWYTESGYYDIAAKFYYREMEVKRKALKYRPNPLSKIRQTLYWLLCGYGEVPWRVSGWAGAVVAGLALIYFAIGTLTPNTFLNSLYYSAVSFTALGYGQWAPQPIGWAKAIGAAEAFIGVFLIALFLVTFTRKMTR